jgi:ankyrin repeat protein
MADEGRPPLHGVVAGGDLPRMLPVLVEWGADVRAVDSHGWTVLHVAGAYGYVGSTRLLLDAGADLAARTPGGLTPAGHGDNERALRTLSNSRRCRAWSELANRDALASTIVPTSPERSSS